MIPHSSCVIQPVLSSESRRIVPQQITLLIPPFTQLNTPYPSISYLNRFLREHKIQVHQRDLSIELALAVFSRDGLTKIFTVAQEKEELPDQAWDMLSKQEQYIRSIDPVIRFLQQNDSSLAQRLCSPSFLPAGPRVSHALPSSFFMHPIPRRHHRLHQNNHRYRI